MPARIRARAVVLERVGLLALWLALTALAPAALAASESPPPVVDAQLLLPERALRPQELGLLINQNDALSVAAGELYARERAIPAANIVRLRLPVDNVKLTASQFAPLQRQVQQQMPASVQALLVTWLQPWRVECMSLTSAFAFGFDRRHCARKTAQQACGPLADSPYFASEVRQPWTTLRLRPTMQLGAASLEQARALIQRGLQSETQTAPGSAWLLSTSDKARNGRASRYPLVQQAFGEWLDVHILHSDRLHGEENVMFYFTGLPQVAGIDSNHFLPGAVADHLTSFGGMLTSSSQMSALAWLRAGATGSYGTVIEPCAMLAKFPDPAVLMRHYLAGERLIQAYWKSVAWPGEGVFVGDPLARPYRGYRREDGAGRTAFVVPWLPPGSYRVQAADAAFGPWQDLGGLRSRGGSARLALAPPVRAYYRLLPLAAGKRP